MTGKEVSQGVGDSTQLLGIGHQLRLKHWIPYLSTAKFVFPFHDDSVRARLDHPIHSPKTHRYKFTLDSLDT